LFVAAKKRKTRLVANDLWELVKDVGKGTREQGTGDKEDSSHKLKDAKKVPIKKETRKEEGIESM